MRLLLGTLWAGATLLYPVLVYVGLRRWPPHVLSLVLAGMLVSLAGLRWASRGAAATGRDMLLLPVLAAGLLVVGAALGQAEFAKAVPVLVSGGLLAAFAASLRGPQSMVERFARRSEPALTAEKVRYCRRVTVVWCWFFVANISVTLALAVAASTAWWTLYTGVIAYVAIATLFASEYVVRKATFRDYGRWWHDRILARVFPPRSHDATD